MGEYQQDNQYTEYNFDFEVEDEDGFVDWVLKNRSELVDEISEETVCNGCSNGWRYVTTNKPFDSQEWQEVIEAYEASQDEE